MIPPPTTASYAMTPTQKYQYSQPADEVGGPSAQGLVRVLHEGADGRSSCRHLTEHPHGEEDEKSADEIGEDGSRSRRADDVSGSDEEACTDDAAERDHGDVPVAQLAAPSGVVSVSTRVVGFAHRAFSL
jgi:hypothetical protein